MNLLIKGKLSPCPTVTQPLASLLSRGKLSRNNGSSFLPAHKKVYRSPVPYNSAQSSSHLTVIRNQHCSLYHQAPAHTRSDSTSPLLESHWLSLCGCLSSEDASILNSACQKLTLVKQTAVSPELDWGFRCEKPDWAVCSRPAPSSWCSEGLWEEESHFTYIYLWIIVLDVITGHLSRSHRHIITWKFLCLSWMSVTGGFVSFNMIKMRNKLVSSRLSQPQHYWHFWF